MTTPMYTDAVQEIQIKDVMMSELELETWEDLANAINKLSAKEKKQPIQCILARSDQDIEECLPLICFDTISNLGFYGSRSIYDNKYHAKDYVLFLDNNPFAEDGATMYEWKGDINTLEENPIYKDGPTKKEEQLAPEKDKRRISNATARLVAKKLSNV